MDFFKFVSQFDRVETVIGLIAFILASVLAFFLTYSKNRLNYINRIISSADTEAKARLANQLVGGDPTAEIPQLTKAQGAKIIELSLKQKSEQYHARLKLIRTGMVLMFLLVSGLIIKSYFDFAKSTSFNISNGCDSPIVNGNNNSVTGNCTVPDSVTRENKNKPNLTK